jgi:hypothetical protein
MTTIISRLPSRFPVGTKFVIEARPCGNGRPPVFVRHLELPDGTLVRLPRQRAAVVEGKAGSRRRLARRG